MKSVHYQEHGVANVWYMGMQFGILWLIWDIMAWDIMTKAERQKVTMDCDRSH